MARTIDQVIKGLPQKQQKQLEKRSRQLVSQYMALQDLRKAMDLTQKDMAKALNISQDGVSRLERRADMLLSTLRKYIEGMGGKLNLVAQFPDRPPVELAGFTENAASNK